MKNQLYIILILFIFVQPVFCQWTEASGTIAASFHNTAVAWEGKVYFTGGPATQFVTSTTYNNKVEVVDLETGATSIAPANSSPGRCAIGGIAFDGKIYFAGGHRWIATAPGLQLYNQLDIFDVATQTWESAQLPTAKTWFAIAVVKEKIMFAGGYVKVGNQIQPTDVVDIYDPSNGTWSVMHLSQPRAELSAGVIDNKVWFCGGQQSWTSLQASSRVDAYDADLDEWTNTELSVARSYPAVATVGQYMICAGGYTNTVGNSSQVDLFNSSNGGSWSTTTLSAPRFGIAAATLGNKAYFTGGGHLDLSASFYNASSNKVDVFDATDGSWSTGTLNKNRVTHSCAVWGNKIAVGGGWRAEQNQTTGSIEILSDSSFVSAKELFETPKFSIFPNPASDALTVSFPKGYETTLQTLTISDLYGRELAQKVLTSTDFGNPIFFNLGEFPSGTYLLGASSKGEGRSFRRFVVVR